MKIKVLIATWVACRLEKKARLERRAFRDFQRQEWRRIHWSEKRARGLRLYIVWSRRREPHSVHERTPDWHTALNQAI